MAPGFVAASGVAIVWLTIGLVSMIILAAMFIALVRHGILVGRTAARFRDEIAPITEEMNALRAARSQMAVRMDGRNPSRRS